MEEVERAHIYSSRFNRVFLSFINSSFLEGHFEPIIYLLDTSSTIPYIHDIEFNNNPDFIVRGTILIPTDKTRPIHRCKNNDGHEICALIFMNGGPVGSHIRWAENIK